jgi:hypothetical protein
MLARRRRRTLVLARCIGLLLAVSSIARAAPPTVEQCLQASDLSLELETQEKLLATRDALRTCASLACPQEVRDECARRIELVEQNIPRVFCEVRDETGRLRHDAQLTIDGRASAAVPQQFIELDPGAHTLTARAPGAASMTQSVALKAREKNRQVRFLLQQPQPSAGLAPQRSAALVAGGLGVASLATASVFAVVALNRKQEAQALCPGATCSTALGAERWQSAWRAGNLTTGFALGGVLALGAAAGLWFSFEQRNAGVALGPTQVQLKARF